MLSLRRRRFLVAPSILFTTQYRRRRRRTQALDIIAPGGQVISVLGVQVDQANYPDKHITEIQGNVHDPNVRALGVSLYSKVTGLLASGALKVRFYTFPYVTFQTVNGRCSDESCGVNTERTSGYSRRLEEIGERRGQRREALLSSPSRRHDRSIIVNAKRIVNEEVMCSFAIH